MTVLSLRVALPGNTHPAQSTARRAAFEMEVIGATSLIPPSAQQQLCRLDDAPAPALRKPRDNAPCGSRSGPDSNRRPEHLHCNTQCLALPGPALRNPRQRRAGETAPHSGSFATRLLPADDAAGTALEFAAEKDPSSGDVEWIARE